ncbi:MAG: host attachment protein [Rhodospirillales bacterium]
MPHVHTNWIVIADGEHARFVKAGAVPHFHTEETFTGDSEEGDGTGSRESPHAAAKHSFAKKLAGRVDELVATERFDDLFLVAPSHVMEDLRGALGAAAAAKVKASLQKDLVKVPDGDLPAHFPDWPLVLAA